MAIAEYLYTATYKLPRLNYFINKIICAIIPKSIRVKNAIVMLNPNDPVISGALAFRVYEKDEISFMQKICQSGKIVIDIGANVGLYTAIAGTSVGLSGRVIAFEPDPDSFHFLEKTVDANKLKNTRIFQAAASAKDGKTKLFTSSVNRGDHRLYSNKNADGEIEVTTLKVDDCLSQLNIKSVDVVKIDVQGFEAHVIEGMSDIIAHSPQLIMLMEFWPQGLSAAKSDPIKFLCDLENLSLRLYEIKKNHHLAPIKNKNELVERLGGRQYTNLVLLGKNAVLK